MDLTSFRQWLITRRYSDSTLRNYLADTNRYLFFIQNQKPFSSESISAYFSYISKDPNSKRYLASLNLFCQFALDQQLISHNPLKKFKKQLHRAPQLTLDSLLQQYQSYLEKHKVAQVTIKNYLNDLKQYFTWLNTKPTPTPPLKKGGQLKVNFLH